MLFLFIYRICFKIANICFFVLFSDVLSALILTLWYSEKSLTDKYMRAVASSENFRTKLHSLGLKISNLEEFRGKIEILSTHVSSVENLQLSVGQLQLSALPNFNPRQH